MASDSTREKIAAALKTAVAKITSVKTVTRTWPSLASLAQFGDPQFPVIAVVAGLPVPFEFKRSGRRPSTVDVVRSALRVSLYLYDRVAEDDGDSRLSDLADDVWAAVWADSTVGGLVDEFSASFPDEVATIDPYIVARLEVRVQYRHDTRGI